MKQTLEGEKMTEGLIQSTNPLTNEVLGSVPNLREAECKTIVEKAKTARDAWAGQSFSYRSQIILKARDIILNQLDEIAELISKENGKPLIEAISHDIMPVMDLMTHFAKNTESLLQKKNIALGKWGALGHQSYIEYYPYGLVLVISPWNFPFSIPLGEITMALLVGNVVVLKPSEITPLIALKIADILHEAGVPKEVFQVATGDGLTGKALINSGVDKIAFTGSVATGKKIMSEAAQSLTPVCLELGGKDPFIVLEDADVDLASSAAVWGAFCNSGQVCASVERVFVHESIAEEFTKQVVEKTKKIRLGAGLDPNTDMASMTMAKQVSIVDSHVKDAKEKGATILAGGKAPQKEGLFYEPTVLEGCDHSFKIVHEESFGPIMPIMAYSDENKMIEEANSLSYALNAYIWSKDKERAKKLASKIIAGTVNINESVFSHAVPQVPFGGPKESGIGRTHGLEGLLELVRVRHVHINKMASKKNNFWWFPYSPEKLQMMKDLCWLLFGSVSKKASSMGRFMKNFFKVKTY